MAKTSQEIDETLDKNWKALKDLPNVLSMKVGTKIVDGKDTGIPCVTIYVTKKKPDRLLRAAARAPKEIEGVPTDVVELNPNGDWEIGETSVSRKSPKIQRILASGVK